jgi:AcrR family transcriptional regulator
VQLPPRRADAQRNSARVVRAAIAAFEEVGAGVPLEEVARRAGIGIATLYRLFGGRDGLVREAFATFFVEELEPLALAARSAHDPWDGLVTALAATVDALAAHRVLLDVARETGAVSVDVAEVYLRQLGDVLAAAQRAGQVRSDLVVRDLAAVVVMALATAHAKDPGGADRRRYLALLLAGMRPSEERLPPPASSGFGNGTGRSAVDATTSEWAGGSSHLGG